MAKETVIELKCFVCGTDNPQMVYLPCYHEGKEKIVCVRCLPVLIHGAH
mgnify:CR=1 FL=1